MILYAGSDTFESERAARTFLAKLVEKQKAQLRIIDATEDSLSQLRQSLEAVGLFASSEVVFIKRPFQNKSYIEYLDQRFDQLHQKQIIMWEPRKVDKRLSLVKELEKHKSLHDFPEGKPWEFSNWVRAFISEQKTELPSAVIQALIDNSEGNKYVVLQELRKLKQAISAKVPVSPEMVAGADIERNVWDLVDQVASGQKTSAMEELNVMLHQGVSEHFLVSMLARELKLIRQVLETQAKGEPLSRLKMPGFVLKKTTAKARRFTLDRVDKLQVSLLRLDTVLKTGSTDPLGALSLYILTWP